jgi:hypothetical protein
MCAYWKRGQRNLWIAYKNGSYKKLATFPLQQLVDNTAIGSLYPIADRVGEGIP